MSSCSQYYTLCPLHTIGICQIKLNAHEKCHKYIYLRPGECTMYCANKKLPIAIDD